MDGRTDGRTDVRTYRRKYGRTKYPLYSTGHRPSGAAALKRDKSNVVTNGQTDRRTDRWTDGRTDEADYRVVTRDKKVVTCLILR